MIVLIIAVVLVLFFLVAVFFSARTWRGSQVTAVVLTFLASILLIISASLSVKTHSTWKKKFADAERQLAQVAEQGERLAYGTAQDVPWGEDSVAGLQQTMDQLIVDRGRAWRHCPPGAPQNGQIVIGTVPPETPPEEVRPNGIEVGTVLYAFKEQPQTGYPLIYLGEFLVAAADPQAVTLTPTLPLDGFQQQQLSDASSTWALYEIMPVDKHAAFAAEPRAEALLDDQPQPLFGQMDEQMLRETFAAVSGEAPDSPLVSALVVPYLRDGTPATEQDVAQVPENIWLKLEFQQEHTMRVDSNNPDAGLTGVYFDAEGYAVSDDLRHGGDVIFKEKDIAVFPYSQEADRAFVDQLISSGVARNLGPFFVRNLRDYEEALHDVADRFVKVMEATRRADRDIKALQKSIAGTQQQTAFRQQESDDLKFDLEKFNFEGQKLTELATTLGDQRTALQAELSNLYKTNSQLNQELSDIDRELTEEINRRTAAAAAQVQ
jgi:hypothetical protein